MAKTVKNGHVSGESSDKGHKAIDPEVLRGAEAMRKDVLRQFKDGALADKFQRAYISAYGNVNLEED